MFCASASLSCWTASPRNGRTASASSQAESHRASRNPLSRKTPTASSSSESLLPPRMTSATLLRTFGARDTPGSAREVLLAPEVPHPPGGSQSFLETERESLWDAELHDVLDRSFANGLHGPEVSQERSLARGPDAFDRVKRGGERFLRAYLAVMGDRKPVRLVADALHQEHARRVPLLHDRLGSIWRKDLLALLRQR